MALDTDRDDATRGAPPRRRRVVRMGLLILTGMILVDAVVGDKGLFALLRAREDRRALVTAVEAIRLENQRLLEQTRRYREDSATVEELARRDLGMIKPGEKLFIIRDLPAAPAR